MNAHQRRKQKRLKQQVVDHRVCEHEGCAETTQDYYEYPVPVDGAGVGEWLCSEHAAEAGFCIYCGGFWAGVESFDFSPMPGVCENCIGEFETEDDDDYEGDDWDFYPESWYDPGSPISELEPSETPRTHFIGEGSEDG